MPVPCFGQSAAHRPRTLSLQAILLCQAALCQPDTQSPLIAAVLAGDAEVLRLAVCKLNPARCGRAEDVMTASLSSCAQQVLAIDFPQLDTMLGETQVV